MSTTLKKSETSEESIFPPLLYYRSREQIMEYLKMPVEEKLLRLEMMAEFFYNTMTEKNKRICDDFVQGKI